MLTISTRPVVRMSSARSEVGKIDGRAKMGKKKMLFVTPMDRAKRFEAHSSQSFAIFVVTTDWPDTLPLRMRAG